MKHISFINDAVGDNLIIKDTYYFACKGRFFIITLTAGPQFLDIPNMSTRYTISELATRYTISELASSSTIQEDIFCVCSKRDLTSLILRSIYSKILDESDFYC